MSQNANLDPFSASAADPLPCFHAWMDVARASEPSDPEAMALATATPAGVPSVRMVLLKEITREGFFVFYTNAESRKGEELAANPRAALCLHWKSLGRQVRIEGPVSGVEDERSDKYFHSRARGSQLGAVASQQSRPLANRAVLEARQAEAIARYPGEISRPEYWHGFAVFAEAIEFWQDRRDRLHDRIVYRRSKDAWQRTLLYP